MQNKLQRLIYHEEYVKINGIDQYLFHVGTSYDHPVLLFLHGGPGSVESLFAHVFQQKWEDIFTVVHWDQRGAGKTLTRNRKQYPTIELLLQDLLEVIQYLKQKYHQQKIVLLGHSWGSVLGSAFIRRYPQEVAYYIGVGQVISILENERVGYAKLKELILQAKDDKSLKKLEAIGDYPETKFNRSWLKKCMKVRKLQGKYHLAIKIDFATYVSVLKSPIFKWSDLTAFFKAVKANQSTTEFLISFDLNTESTEYQVPVYYILGANDWQTPYVIAQEYFGKIKAPNKKLYLIPNAGHMTMLDQPELVWQTLFEIHNHEQYNQNKMINAC